RLRIHRQGRILRLDEKRYWWARNGRGPTDCRSRADTRLRLRDKSLTPSARLAAKSVRRRSRVLQSIVVVDRRRRKENPRYPLDGLRCHARHLEIAGQTN